MTKASLPWVVGMLAPIAVAAFTSAPFWVVLALWAVLFLGWLLVQITMLAEIVRVKRGRR